LAIDNACKFTGCLQLGCDDESYDFRSSPILSLRSDPTVSSMERPVVQLAGPGNGCGSDPEGAVMKNLYEVLHSKEEMVCQLRRETEELRFLIGLLDREDGTDASLANASATNASSRRPAVYLLTNSGRLEVVVRGAPRLRFAGPMRMPMEILRVGNEFHIFVPTPEPGGASSGLIEEGAA